MSKNSLNIKELIKGILIVMAYILIPSLLIMPFILLITPNSLGLQQLLTNIIMLIILICIFYKDLLKEFKKYKKNFKKYFIIALKYWAIGVSIMLISSYIYTKTGIATSINQENNNILLKDYTIIAIICSVICAPIIEELIFRRSFKDISNNIHIYAIITGIIFGSIHVISSLKNPLMLLHLIPYCSVAISLGYAYKKTNNIWTTIIMHMIHNIITIIYLFTLGGI